MKKNNHRASADEMTGDALMHHEQGLSTGPAQRISSRAREFACDCTIETSAGRVANAKELLELLVLGVGLGERVTVTCRGRDSSAALQAIIDCFETKRGIES